MRRAALVLGPFTVLAGAVFACENDPEGVGGPTFQLDGSAPSFDGGQQEPFDSSVPDTTTPDAPSGPPSVTVTATGFSGPKAGVRVVFHDASGAVLETKLTDASGKAKSTTAALPAMASALIATQWRRQIVTWTSLENGDDLTVREPGDDGESDATLGWYDVTMPGLFDDAGATSYTLRAGDCVGFAEGSSASIGLYPSCISSGKSAVLVTAFDLENQIAGHSFKKGNSVPLDGGSTAIATGPWATPTTVTVTAANAPQQRSVQVDLLEVADGHGYRDGFNHSLDNGSATFATATGFAEALQASLYVIPPTGGQQMIMKRAAPSATITLDAAQVLPAIEFTNIADGTNGKRPVIQWSSASTAAADGGVVRLQFWGPNEQQFVWTLVVPPGSTTVTAPALPAEADAFLPDQDAGMLWQPPEVVFIEADVIPSYKAFRSLHGKLAPAGTSFMYGFPAVPQNGTYRASGWVLAL